MPLLLMLISVACAWSQGMASANKPAAPRTLTSSEPFTTSFLDVSRASGLTAPFVQGNPARRKYIVEANGTGVAFLDYDNDGRLDIFLVNGSQFPPATVPAPVNHLYRNTGGGKFADVTRNSGVGRSGWGNGVCTGDIDNDGLDELYVTYWGANSLFRNTGSGVFKDIAAAAGVAGDGAAWSTGCTFIDYDRDGLLDLFVATYVDFQLKSIPLPGANPACLYKDVAVFCGPRGLPHGRLTLYRNKGDGTFEDRSEASGIRKPGGCYGFSAVTADLNRDGWPDIYLACDSTPSLYFRNNKNGTFSELATEASIAYNEHGAEQAGMGVAVGDFNQDGWLDITKTNFIRDYPNLYRNLGGGIFEDIALSAGLGVNPQYVLWGTGFEDFDNDGRVDIFQVGGHVYPELEQKFPEERYAAPRLLYRGLPNGKFEDVSARAGAGLASRHASHGAAFGDFDNDGDIDILIMNQNEPPSLLRNDAKPENGWVKVLLQGTSSNRSAIGAIVTVVAGDSRRTAAVTSQSSYLSVNDRRLHFGLGAAAAVEKVIVRWPSGVVEEFPGGPSRSLLRLVEGSAKTNASELRP